MYESDSADSRLSSIEPMDHTAIALLERVRKYALPYGPPRCRRILLRQRGEVRMAPEQPWLPFTAEQTLDTVGLDFRWRAQSRILRWLPVTVVDAFETQLGRLSVNLFGLIPLAKFHGPPADKAEVMRAIAELPLRPFGFALRHDLMWETTPAGHLRASYDRGQIRASVDFEVDSDGRILSAHASDRPRVIGRSIAETPWSGVFDSYRFFDQIHVPTVGEASWNLPESRFTYWRGEITQLRLIND